MRGNAPFSPVASVSILRRSKRCCAEFLNSRWLRLRLSRGNNSSFLTQVGCEVIQLDLKLTLDSQLASTICHSDEARSAKEESAFLDSTHTMSTKSRFLLVALLLVGMTKVGSCRKS